MLLNEMEYNMALGERNILMTKIYKNSRFSNWQKKNKIHDSALIKAVEEMESGLIDANLGGDIFKKRIAKPGMGKSGSYRTIIAAKRSIGWVSIFGFDKTEMDNIDNKTLLSFKEYSSHLFSEINKYIDFGLIFEVLQNDK